MKRVLCIVGAMDAGGAETFMMKVMRNVNKDVLSIDFAVSSPTKGLYEDEIAQLGGTVFHITSKSVSFVKNFRDIYAVVRDNQYENVLRISQNALSGMELYAAWFAGAKVRAFRSSNSQTYSNSLKEIISHRVFKFFLNLVSNVKLAPSIESAEFMFGKRMVKKDKVAIIKNGINTKDFLFNELQRNELRVEYKIPEDGFVIGHIGRFNKQKNHKYLINVFHEVRTQRPNTHLFLVGQGELMEEIKDYAGIIGDLSYIHFLGVRKDIPELLCLFDCFVFPSLFEGMPNTVIEAQASGLPCIVSDTITKDVAITDLVTFISLQDSPATWAEKILSIPLKHDRTSYKTMIDSKGYNIENTINDFVGLFV